MAEITGSKFDEESAGDGLFGSPDRFVSWKDQHEDAGTYEYHYKQELPNRINGRCRHRLSNRH